MHAAVAILTVVAALLVCCSAQTSSQKIVTRSDLSGTATSHPISRQFRPIGEEVKNENAQEKKEHNIQSRHGVTDGIDNMNRKERYILLRRRGGIYETDGRNIEVGSRRLQNLLNWQGGIDDIDARNIDVGPRSLHNHNIFRRQEDMDDTDVKKLNIGQRRLNNKDVGQRRFQAIFNNLQ